MCSLELKFIFSSASCCSVIVASLHHAKPFCLSYNNVPIPVFNHMLGKQMWEKVSFTEMNGPFSYPWEPPMLQVPMCSARPSFPPAGSCDWWPLVLPPARRAGS